MNEPNKLETPAGAHEMGVFQQVTLEHAEGDKDFTCKVILKCESHALITAIGYALKTVLPGVVESAVEAMGGAMVSTTEMAGGPDGKSGYNA